MLESAESQVPKLIIREIIIEEFQGVWSTIHCYRRTDRQTTYHGSTALHYALHGKKEDLIIDEITMMLAVL